MNNIDRFYLRKQLNSDLRHCKAWVDSLSKRADPGERERGVARWQQQVDTVRAHALLNNIQLDD